MDLEQETYDINKRLNRISDMLVENEGRFFKTLIKYCLIASAVVGIGVPVASKHYAKHEVGLYSQARELNAEISQVKRNIFGKELFYYRPADTTLTQTEFIERAAARRDSLVHEMYNPISSFNEYF
ncbi:hypothetical protein HYT23_00485 [Candidatus Pacearchaeota archaeon]|nr:hypothetical protein [Candidatus Pacearchaeota archaeon]